MATAELQASVADSDRFEGPVARHRLYLLPPDTGCRRGPVRLVAVVDHRGSVPLRPADVRWRSDLDGDLGTGLALSVELTPGRHHIEASAPDGAGGIAADRSIIVVGGSQT